MVSRMKPEGGECVVREQICEDVVSNLVLWFERYDDGPLAGAFRLTVVPLDEAKPILEFGNRELIFEDGIVVGTGTSLVGARPATWLRAVPPATEANA